VPTPSTTGKHSATRQISLVSARRRPASAPGRKRSVLHRVSLDIQPMHRSLLRPQAMRAAKRRKAHEEVRTGLANEKCRIEHAVWPRSLLGARPRRRAAGRLTPPGPQRSRGCGFAFVHTSASLRRPNKRRHSLDTCARLWFKLYANPEQMS